MVQRQQQQQQRHPAVCLCVSSLGETENRVKSLILDVFTCSANNHSLSKSVSL